MTGETNADVAAGALLTILIPSYNRGPRARALVNFLLPTVDEFGGKIELVVSNNVSTDGTEKMFGHIKSPYFRLHNRVHHLPTAEEHIFDSVAICQGEYVWFHGDDDLTSLETLRFTMGLLATGEHDFLYFGSLYIDSDGATTGGRFVFMNSDLIQLDFSKAACALGPTSSFAGISNSICRRANLEHVDTENVLSHAAIYSHVAWWLIAFKGCTMTIINRPLVSYRVDDDTMQFAHFSKVAVRLRLPDYYFWAVGLVELLQFLEDSGALSADDIRSIFEFRRDGGSFRLLDNVVHMIHLQAAVTASDDEPRNRLSGETFERITDWVLRLDPGYFECVQVIKDLHSLRTNPELDELPRGYTPSRFFDEEQDKSFDACVNRLKVRFTRLLERKIISNAKIGIIGRFKGYVIYRHVSGLVAFDEECPIDRQAVLRWLDIRPMDDTILFAESEEVMRDAIDQARNVQREFRSDHAARAMSEHQTRVIDSLARIAESNTRGMIRLSEAVILAGRFYPSLLRAAIWRIRAAIRKFRGTPKEKSLNKYGNDNFPTKKAKHPSSYVAPAMRSRRVLVRDAPELTVEGEAKRPL